MVHEKIKDRKRLFPDKEGTGKGKKPKDHIAYILIPTDRLVKACPGVENPTLIFKDGNFTRA